jgi:hypothetical protein
MRPQSGQRKVQGMDADADLPSLLFKIDNAADVGIGDQVADLVVAKSALGALKMDESHSEPPR